MYSDMLWYYICLPDTKQQMSALFFVCKYLISLYSTEELNGQLRRVTMTTYRTEIESTD